ncbi:MAG: cupin domain-containing protein [Deltaproteobacteria bacterium]|nr:cupin domain-containing protein [Deltaproteobacteria bacterium]
MSVAPVIHQNAAMPWTALAPGIEMQIFHADAETGEWTVKIFMHAGSTLPRHRHVGASEFYILDGRGTHEEAGKFEPGTYAFEPADALHSPVHVHEDVKLFMASYGPSVFLEPSGDTLYVGDATYFAKQMERGPLARAVKRFFFITVWKLFTGKN